MQEGIFRTYIVDNHCYRLYINTAGEDVRRNEYFCFSASELINDTITVVTLHGSAELRNLVPFGSHASLKLLSSFSCLFKLARAIRDAADKGTNPNEDDRRSLGHEAVELEECCILVVVLVDIDV